MTEKAEFSSWNIRVKRKLQRVAGDGRLSGGMDGPRNRNNPMYIFLTFILIFKVTFE